MQGHHTKHTSFLSVVARIDLPCMASFYRKPLLLHRRNETASEGQSGPAVEGGGAETTGGRLLAKGRGVAPLNPVRFRASLPQALTGRIHDQ